MISGDKGEAPEPKKRTRPPIFAFILLNTNLSQIGDGFRPKQIQQITDIIDIGTLDVVAF